MKNLTSHPFAGEKDLQPLIELMTASGSDEIPIYDWPKAGEGNTRLWEDDNGNLIAAGLAWDGYILQFLVQPQAKGRAIETQVITWGLDRARETGRANLFSRACEDDSDRIAILKRHGFVRDEDYLLGMARLLDDPIPTPQLPEGFTVRHFTGESDAEAWVAMYNDPIIDGGMTVEQRMFDLKIPGYMPELDLIAVAPDDTFAAYCMGSINRSFGGNRGLVDPVGTRPRFRRMGLARALLLTSLHRMKSHGVDIATIVVSSKNPGALRLYESIGFQSIYKRFYYLKNISGTSQSLSS